MNFDVAILVLKTEEMINIFGMFCFIILRQVKTQQKHTHKQMCTLYGEGAVTDEKCYKWRVKFHSGDFSLDAAPHPVDQLR